MTPLKYADSFLLAVMKQQELNRKKHQDATGDEEKNPIDWGVIAAEHMGHLMGALHKGNRDDMEKEILHVAGPLLECWNRLKSDTNNLHTYRCIRCEKKFELSRDPSKNCPICEGTLKKIEQDA